MRSSVCEALIAGDRPHALALIRSREQLQEFQPPEGVSQEIWTELLLNACTASEAQLPALQLVESRSLPRSGHHFVKNLLQQACGEQFSYCEGYHEPGCCRNSPCSVAAYWHFARGHPLAHLRLLKSHDFALKDATFTPPAGMVRLIQVRRPLELLASWLEALSSSLDRVFLYHEPEVLEEAWRLIDEHGAVMPSEHAQAWLASKCSYVQAFLQKWLPQARPFPFGGRVSGGTYLLRYSDLARSEQILEAFGLRGMQERPLPVFTPLHPDVTVRRSIRVTNLIQEHFDAVELTNRKVFKEPFAAAVVISMGRQPAMRARRCDTKPISRDISCLAAC